MVQQKQYVDGLYVFMRLDATGRSTGKKMFFGTFILNIFFFNFGYLWKTIFTPVRPIYKKKEPSRSAFYLYFVQRMKAWVISYDPSWWINEKPLDFESTIDTLGNVAILQPSEANNPMQFRV